MPTFIQTTDPILVEIVLLASLLFNILAIGHFINRRKGIDWAAIKAATHMRLKWVGLDGSETMYYSLWDLGKNKHKLLRRRRCRCWFDDQDLCLVIEQKGSLGRG